MIVIKGKKYTYFDVDDTLIMWDYDLKSSPENHVQLKEQWEHGHTLTLCKNPLAIAALIDAKERGDVIVVWSQSGADWAEEAVNKLGLVDFVDLCISKPHVWYDDIPAERVFTDRIDIGKQYYERAKK
jgi:FMN phosphatase YigB (HAD superfamily)